MNLSLARRYACIYKIEMKNRIILWIWVLLFNITVFSQVTKERFAKSILTDNISDQEAVVDEIADIYSSFSYTYYKLLLGNLPRHSILITNAYDDTFPLRVLQLKESIRPDVQLISIAMLKADSLYRARIGNRYNLKLEGKSISKQVQLIISSNSNVFVSTTVKKTVWYRPKNYLIGLSVQSNDKNNRKRLIAFYQGYQKLKLNTYHFNEKDRQIIRNLIPPLIVLYKNGSHYSNLRTDILMIADIVGNKSKVLKILDGQ